MDCDSGILCWGGGIDGLGSNTREDSSCRDVDWEKDAAQSTSFTVGEADYRQARKRRIDWSANLECPQLTMQL